MEGFDKELTSWIQAVYNELEGKNFRSIAILCASILDVQLERLIKCVLRDDSKIDEQLFDVSMPLSTFSSKISMAYYMGLISEHEKQTLATIRKIRNRVAHEIDINNGRVLDSIDGLTMSLVIPKGMYLPIELFCGDISQINIDYNPDCERDITQRFVNTFYYITEYLSFHKLVCSEEGLSETDSVYPYQYVEMVRDLLLEDNRRILEKLYQCADKARTDIEILRNQMEASEDSNPIEYRGLTLKSKISYQEAIEIVSSELAQFIFEIKMRESGDYSAAPESNYANTCENIKILDGLIETMKKYGK